MRSTHGQTHDTYITSKCAVLRINLKTSFRCTINNIPLKEENVKKDKEIIVPNFPRLKKHAVGVYTQLNRTPGLVKRCFTNLDKHKFSTWQLLLDSYWNVDILFGHHGLFKISRVSRGSK